MALLLNIRKTLIKQLFLHQKPISTTSSLLWLNERMPRSDSSKREKYYMKKDRVPQNYQMIYRAPMESYVAWTMHVSTLTASIIGGASIYQYASNQQTVFVPLDSELIMQSEDIYYFAAGFLVINAILRMIVNIFPLRIYKNQGEYLAVYHSQLPGGLSHHNFHQGQVKAAHNLFSPWNNATYKLGTKTSLLLEDYFKTSAEFYKMCEIEKKTQFMEKEEK